MSEDQQPAAPVAGPGILKFFLSRKGQAMEFLSWTVKAFIRTMAGIVLFVPLILAGSAGWTTGGLAGIAPAVWETLATYVELYGILGFLIVLGALVIGKSDELSTVKDFQSFLNSLILATIVALIHYQPVLTMHK
jgi:hypothetical protein